MSAQQLSILDALENLNAIVDAPNIDHLELTEEDHFILHDMQEKEDYWLAAGANTQTLNAVQKTLHTIIDYLEKFYQKVKVEDDKRLVLSGVNAVMVLVGEATKKLERYDQIFKQQITHMPEYHDLQEFYRTKVVKQAFAVQTHSKKQHPEPSTNSGTHILNELHLLKEDRLYELFYLKNEEGHPFYTNALSKNIKLACDFGAYADQYWGEDPLLQISIWNDKIQHLKAKAILQKLSNPLKDYFALAMPSKNIPLISRLNQCIMALMLAANERNLLRQFSIKGCGFYFQDFLLFFKEVLNEREYQKLKAYGVEAQEPVFICAFKLIEKIAHHLFESSWDKQEVEAFIKKHMPAKHMLSLPMLIEKVHQTLDQVMNLHPNGPILKVLDVIRQQQELHFDPMLLGCTPDVIKVQMQDKEIKLLRLSSPITQHAISEAQITEEFRTYLHQLKSPFLYVNVQNRASWQDKQRCQVIEQLSMQAEFAAHLHVITLPTTSALNQQMHEYEAIDDNAAFIQKLSEQLFDPEGAYFFCSNLKQVLFPQQIKQLLFQVHKKYFDDKKVLSKEERLQFISLVHTHLIAVCLQHIQATAVAIGSKDGLDSACIEITKLRFLLEKSHDEKANIELIVELYAPIVLIRERLPHAEDIHQLVDVLKKIGQVRS